MSGITTTPNGLDTQSTVNSSMPMCDNITDTAIRITESKARLVYRNHINKINGELVLSLFGLFLTFIITVLTSEFNDVFEIENSKYILNAAFVILTIATGIASGIYLVKWIVNRKKYNENSFISALKGNDTTD